ncbi:TPA: hypothetical protein ACGNP9_001531 [Streptococcus agalactiae]
MVPKQVYVLPYANICFRAVLFRMVPKHDVCERQNLRCFRAVLFRMVPKR